MIKKIFLSVLFCTISMFTMAQSSNVTHVVQRGETIESIAEYYKVSVEDINKANPNADGIVYVGMKLNIPAQQNVMANNQDTSLLTSEHSKGNTSPMLNKSSVNCNVEPSKFENSKSETQKGRAEIASQFVFRFGSLNGDGAECYKSTFGFSLALGARYFVADQIFVEGLAGYRYLWTSWKKEYAEAILERNDASGDLITNSIYIPLYVGAKIDDFSIKAGPYFDYIVSGNEKFETPCKSNKKEQKNKIDKGQLSVGVNLTVLYKMYGLNFNIGLSNYANNKKCKEMAIGLMIGL